MAIELTSSPVMAPQPTPPVGTKALNLRDIPLPLYTQIKTSAAAANMGVRDFVVSLLEAHMHGQCQGRATVSVVISAVPSSPLVPAGQTGTIAASVPADDPTQPGTPQGVDPSAS